MLVTVMLERPGTAERRADVEATEASSGRAARVDWTEPAAAGLLVAMVTVMISEPEMTSTTTSDGSTFAS